MGRSGRESLKRGMPTKDGVVLRVASSGARVQEIMVRALASGAKQKRNYGNNRSASNDLLFYLKI